MKGSEILLSAHPRGMFLEGIINDTSLPGTIMQETSAAMVGGRPTWQAATLAGAGNPTMQAILLPDALQGGTYSRAYVAGTRCFLYVPYSGEDMNVMCGVSGTVTFAIGDKLITNTSGGVLIQAGASTAVQYICQEALVNQAVPALVWVMRA